MRIATAAWSSLTGWGRPLSEENVGQTHSDLVLAFWRPTADPTEPLKELQDRFPRAVIVGCSTAGHIVDSDVVDSDFVATIVGLRTSEVQATSIQIRGPEHSRQAGQELAVALLSMKDTPPKAVVVISDGLIVNGSELVGGLVSALPDGLPISGGLAGDGAYFSRTFVSLGSEVTAGHAVAVGLWGEGLTVAHGSAGGWEPFGPIRTITRSKGSTVYELDGQPTLELYRNYLGDKASGLPAAALLFPLRIRDPDGPSDLARTILAMDDTELSMRFAGDMPEGWSAQMMRTTIDRLVDGALDAGEQARQSVQGDGDSLAFAVSCVGRRLVLGDRADEELEACLDALGDRTALRGFYSYGEISPADGYVGLHNQTMTLTTISEAGP
ncbi:MAG: FIST signal transduction protein [Candidatus Nanopelagicales bacterium]